MSKAVHAIVIAQPTGPTSIDTPRVRLALAAKVSPRPSIIRDTWFATITDIL